MSWLVVVLLAFAVVIVLAKWLFLKRELAAMAKTIQRIHDKRSNERITVSSRDKGLDKLANEVNELYRDIAGERSVHDRTAIELRKNMDGISYALRTPLTSIIGYTNLMKKDGVTDGQRLRYLSIVSAKSESLHYLVNKIFT